MKVIRVYLKYGPNNEAVIRDLQRVSRPGLPRLPRPATRSAAFRVALASPS